jgi:hypothetical protein
MPELRINGTLSPVPQAPEYDFSPQGGLVVTQRWESAGDNLRGLFAGYTALRVASNMIPSKGRSVLVARASGPLAGEPETTTDTWQIMANEIQKDVKEHPTFLAMEELFPGTIGYVVRDVDRYNQGLGPDTPAPPPGAAATAALLFGLLVRGTTHYALSQYVLRHTTNVSNQYAANVADTNIERTYTTAQLLAEAQNVNSWAYPLPGRMTYKITNIAAPALHSGYLWGWRKLASTETTSANMRIEITTEYWLEQWPLVLYPIASA